MCDVMSFPAILSIIGRHFKLCRYVNLQTGYHRTIVVVHLVVAELLSGGEEQVGDEVLQQQLYLLLVLLVDA